MIYPSIDEMLKTVDSRYSLAILAAKRARQLRDKHIAKGESGLFKEVTSALEEIASGKITFERTKDGIKEHLLGDPANRLFHLYDTKVILRYP